MQQWEVSEVEHDLDHPVLALRPVGLVDGVWTDTDDLYDYPLTRVALALTNTFRGVWNADEESQPARVAQLPAGWQESKCWGCDAVSMFPATPASDVVCPCGQTLWHGYGPKPATIAQQDGDGSYVAVQVTQHDDEEPSSCGCCGSHDEDDCTCFTCSECDHHDKWGDLGPAECCEGCGYCCTCSKCGNCGSLLDECDIQCEDCGACNSCCQCVAFGRSEEAPWVARGVDASLYEGSTTRAYDDSCCAEWGIDTSLDLSQVFADFYLLEWMAGNVGVNLPAGATAVELREAQAVATTLRADLIARVEPSLLAYTRMAVWGEARYHKALGRKSVSRERAWLGGRIIEERGGPDVYAELADLFDEMESARSSIGGPKWAAAARVVHLRLTGAIDAATFLDRVLSMQHNGGSLFNKVVWQKSNPLGWGLEAITLVLGDAQASNPPVVRFLWEVASDEVRSLWKRWNVAATRARVSYGLRPMWDQVSGLRSDALWIFESDLTRRPRIRGAYGLYDHQGRLTMLREEWQREAAERLAEQSQPRSEFADGSETAAAWQAVCQESDEAALAVSVHAAYEAAQTTAAYVSQKVSVA